MTTPNYCRFKGSINGAKEPLRVLGKFVAGASQAIAAGELLELTGSTNTTWVPLDSDFAMAANVAIADENIVSGDRAGYYWIIVPRPGDVFEFALASAAAAVVGASVYYSSSVAVASSGTHALGRVVGQQHYPQNQYHASAGNPSDAGVTIKSTSYVDITIRQAASYYAALQATT